MVSYTCYLCLKIFNKKSGFVRHTEARKTPCCKNNDLDTEIIKIKAQKAQNENLKHNIAQNENLKHNIAQKKPENKEVDNDYSIKYNNDDITPKCLYCNKILSRLSSLKRHYNICNMKNNIIEQLKIENEKLKNEQKIKDEENEKLKMEVEKLNNSIVNKSTLINNGTINIKIVNYGEEDLAKLDINKILKYENSFIEMVFRDIHCNSEFPEYQNILLPSLTRYDLYVKFNDEWLKRNKKEILTERYTAIRGYIMELYDKEKEINKGRADNSFFHFLKQIKLVDPTNSIYKPQEEKKIIDGIANVLYNHKNNIKSTDKTPVLTIKKI